MLTKLAKVGSLEQEIIGIEDYESQGFKIKTLILCNTTNDPAIIDIKLIKNEKEFYLIKNNLIEKNRSLIIFGSKDECLFLEPGDKLIAQSDKNNSVDSLVSYDLIQEITPRLFINFNQQLNFLSTSSNKAIPNDLVFEILNEKYGNQEVFNLVESIEHFETNTFLVKLNSNYKPSDSNRISFQIRLNDPRFSAFNKKFYLSNATKYETNLKLSESAPGFFRQDLTSDTIDYLIDWINDFWFLYDTNPEFGFDLRNYFYPPNPEQINDYFNPFGHAIYEICKQNNISNVTLNEIENYIIANIEEFKSYSLNRSLIEKFFNEGTPTEIDLDNVSNLVFKELSSCGGPNISLVADTNPFGVNPSTYKCMSQDPPMGNGPLYYNNGNQHSAFDCRSFSESQLIFLRNQLSEICPNATCGIFNVPQHQMIWVDLGGICKDGNPCCCCEGNFIFDPITSTTYKSRQEYCASQDTYPCAGEYMPPDFNNDAANNNFNNYANATQWSKYPSVVQRITSVICSCVQNASGPAEENIRNHCNDGTIKQWLIDNYDYGNQTKNGPNNNNPQISGLPKTLDCEKYICDEKLGCIKDPAGDLSEYECKTYCFKRWDCQNQQQTNLCGTCKDIGYSTDNQAYKSEEDCVKNCPADCYYCDSSDPNNKQCVKSQILGSMSLEDCKTTCLGSSSSSSSSEELFDCWICHPVSGPINRGPMTIESCDNQGNDRGRRGGVQDKNLLSCCRWGVSGPWRPYCPDGECCYSDTCKICSSSSSSSVCDPPTEGCNNADWNYYTCKCCPENSKYCAPTKACVECDPGFKLTTQQHDCSCECDRTDQFCLPLGSVSGTPRFKINKDTCLCDCNLTLSICSDLDKNDILHWDFDADSCECVETGACCLESSPGTFSCLDNILEKNCKAQFPYISASWHRYTKCNEELCKKSSSSSEESSSSSPYPKMPFINAFEMVTWD